MSFVVRSLVLLTFLGTTIRAQGTPANPPAHQLQRANQLFVAGDWKGVLSAYEALLKNFPDHALSRFRVGVAQMELGHLDAAESNLREGERLGVFPGMAAYRLSQLHAERGQGDKAIAELERAAAAKFAITPPAIEITTDSGKTWRANYDLMYVRRAQPSGSTDTLSAASRAEILALDSAFVRGWLRDDTASVLGVFAESAVLQPPGAAAITGHAAIRAYWFPADGSSTRILSFDHQVVEVVGSSTLAFVRGASTLKWRYSKDGKSTEQTGRSSDLRVYAADPSGKWKVIRQIWTTLP